MLAHHAGAKITWNCSPSDNAIIVGYRCETPHRTRGAFKPPQAAADSAWPISRSFR